jgi:glucose-6-phosphate isomerase
MLKKKLLKIFLKKKKIPFRSFEIKKRDEKTLGELFCFFMLETILISKALKVNPYDQPAVETIKKETKKILI